MDIFGKFEEFEDAQDIDNDVLQLSEYTLYSMKTNYIYVTDEFGTMKPLLMTNAGKMMNHFIRTEQYDVANDVMDLMISFDSSNPVAN